jgi:hypothetical protein
VDQWNGTVETVERREMLIMAFCIGNFNDISGVLVIHSRRIYFHKLLQETSLSVEVSSSSADQELPQTS